MKQLLFAIDLCLFVFSTLSFIDKPLQDEWKAPEEARSVKNPNEARKKGIKNAESIYKMRCVLCHGEKGKGDGLEIQSP